MIGGRLRKRVLGEESAPNGPVAEVFPDEGIVVTLSRQLSWSPFPALLPLSRPFQRELYAEMSRAKGWSVGKAPYILDFLDLKDHCLERKLHDAIAAARLRLENNEPGAYPS